MPVRYDADYRSSSAERGYERALDGMNWKRGKAVFRKRVKTRLQISLERAGVDLSMPLGRATLDAMVHNGLSNYSLLLITDEDSGGFEYSFYAGPSELYVCNVGQSFNGWCEFYVRSANEAINRLEWNYGKMHSQYDLFGRPLKDV